jgi:hypothetical protein
MKINQLVVPVAAAALLLMSSISLATQATCNADDVKAVKDAIAAQCPCAGPPDDGGTVPWKNHGQYVRCVTKAKKTLAGDVARQCLNRVVPCAANSTCGKQTAVACVETTPGTCLDGACDNDSGKSCATDEECSQSTCFIADSVEDCPTGTPTVGSCCE